MAHRFATDTGARVRGQGTYTVAFSLLALVAALCLGSVPGCKTADRRILDLRERENNDLRVRVKQLEVLLTSSQGTVERLRGELRALEEERAGLAEKFGRADANERIQRERANTLERSRDLQEESLRRAEQAIEEDVRLREYVASELEEVSGWLKGVRSGELLALGAQLAGEVRTDSPSDRVQGFLLLIAQARARLHEASTLLRKGRLPAELAPELAGRENPGVRVVRATPLHDAGKTPLGLPKHVDLQTGDGTSPVGEDSGDKEAQQAAEPSFWAEISGLVKTRFSRLVSSDRKWKASDVGFLGALLIVLGLILFAVSIPLRVLWRRRRTRALAALEELSEEAEDSEPEPGEQEESTDEEGVELESPSEAEPAEQEPTPEEPVCEEEPRAAEEEVSLADSAQDDEPRPVSEPAAESPAEPATAPENASPIPSDKVEDEVPATEPAPDEAKETEVQGVRLPDWLGSDEDARPLGDSSRRVDRGGARPEEGIAASAPESEAPTQSASPPGEPAPQAEAPGAESAVDEFSQTQPMPDLDAETRPFGRLRLKLTPADAPDATVRLPLPPEEEPPSSREEETELSRTDLLPVCSTPDESVDETSREDEASANESQQDPRRQEPPARVGRGKEGPSGTQAMPDLIADEFTQTQPMPDLVPQDHLAGITDALGVHVAAREDAPGTPSEESTPKADSSSTQEMSRPTAGEFAETQSMPEVPHTSVTRDDLSPLEKLLRASPEDRARTQRIPIRKRRKPGNTREMVRPANEDFTSTQPMPEVGGEPPAPEQPQSAEGDEAKTPTETVPGVVLREYANTQSIPDPEEGLPGTETIPDVTLEDLRNTDEIPTLEGTLEPPTASDSPSEETKKPSREMQLLAELEELLGRKLDEPTR